MTILDRYIIRSFIRNYLLSFLVLVGMYVALDMIFNFDELTRGATSAEAAKEGGDVPLLQVLQLAGRVIGFYAYQVFAFFVQLSGIIPVVAAAFTLMRMTRFNELTAMLAAGVPLLRIAAPVIVIGALFSALVVADQELIIPRIAHKLSRQHDELAQLRTSSFPVAAMEDAAGSVLWAARYTPPDGKAPATLQRVDVIQFNADAEPVAYVQAYQATYDRDAKLWHLEGARKQTGLRPQDPITTSEVKQWRTSIGPEEIALKRRASFVDLLSTSQVNTLLGHPRNYGTVPLLRVKHWRIVQPIMNVILILLAIPCVLTREPTGLKKAALRTVLLTGSCLAVVFACMQLAANPPSPAMTRIWPMLMLWLPVFVFAPLAVWQLDRVKS